MPLAVRGEGGVAVGDPRGDPGGRIPVVREELGRVHDRALDVDDRFLRAVGVGDQLVQARGRDRPDPVERLAVARAVAADEAAPAAADDALVAAATGDPVVAVAQDDRVVLAAAVDHVVARAAVDEGIARLDVDLVALLLARLVDLLRGGLVAGQRDAADVADAVGRLGALDERPELPGEIGAARRVVEKRHAPHDDVRLLGEQEPVRVAVVVVLQEAGCSDDHAAGGVLVDPVGADERDDLAVVADDHGRVRVVALRRGVSRVLAGRAPSPSR